MVQQLVVLGATGSIGQNTLDVVARHSDRWQVFALTAHRNVDRLLEQCLRFNPVYAVVVDPDAGRDLELRLANSASSTRVLVGATALLEVAQDERVHAVMAAIVGAAGLPATMAAAYAGKRVLLANKEALVVAGDLFMQAITKGGAELLPIDSEHSAIFQSLPMDRARWSVDVDHIILTASGGPFRTWEPAALRQVTPEQACAHPNWVMGRKISVDSATMMNKALEVIEAHYLFGMEPDRIRVVIHPQSVIHSMVQYVDNSVVAQLGTPDMRGPIAYGLSWPERVTSGASALDFARLQGLTFEDASSPGHQQRYPGLQLAWDSMRAPFGTTAVLNAANEVAVQAFLDKRIRFDQIHLVNANTLERVLPSQPSNLQDLLELDKQARAVAHEWLARCGTD
ncbi:1-deoxy-D-xylulose-5-phosphate reductoisomerase [Curvibacter sp. CHRR-16]|uniref:1-deoxy-D-xylulose-5-phosphate reductoisomerase n=1 Tax=Curvibacter sp. CHRR-16 TaxID=2835872 RepID=UPI001BD91AFD|nr:1-deoxy-D-xylulose-5-phosphate reductoisomerase [Curvibacter sp. CHRR-16]MBT0570860.1 1-deoxy-D-xylulose-5-phosphate reductoisomerase [Curvibacter sp. CHRR-16]